MYKIDGNTGTWEVVIGLEVHCQILSTSKLFSGASATFGDAPNMSVSYVDAAFPGMLPVLNEFCLEQAVKTSLALKGKINLVSRFDRKHYFYGDLPSGYQISQFYLPLMEGGRLKIELNGGVQKEINITRLHMEQDAGKMLHEHHPNSSLIDLNRAGVGLMEIVSEPDIRSPEEAGAYLKALRAIVRTIETCDGNMEEGSMRCDINVSVRKSGEPFRTRTETKNVNSIRFVMQAIEYEAKRQVEVWESGNSVFQETRLFDSSNGTTRSMRSKEDAADYRYFPDPDLLPITLTEEYISKIKQSMPLLPEEKKEKFISQYSLSEDDAYLISADKDYSNYFESMLNGKRSAKLCANLMISTLFAILNKNNLSINESPIDSTRLAALVDLIEADVISGRIAKDVFDIMLEDKSMPADIVEAKGLKQITDTSAIESIIDKLIQDNADKVAEIKAGKDKMFGWFVGQAMKETQGKANPSIVNSILKKKLDNA